MHSVWSLYQWTQPKEKHRLSSFHRKVLQNALSIMHIISPYMSPLPPKKVCKRCQHVKGLSPVSSLTNTRLNTEHNQYLHVLRKAILPPASASPRELSTAGGATGCYWQFHSPACWWGNRAQVAQPFFLKEIRCQGSLVQDPFLINNVQDD